MFKKIRISILLLILAYVAYTSYVDMRPNWDKPIRIVVHPINIYQDAQVQAYINGLKQSDFDEITNFMSTSATRYRKKKTSIQFILGSQLDKSPSQANEEIASSVLKTMLWSLRFRWYALINQTKLDFGADSKVFVNYYPKKIQRSMERSTALQKGRIAYVNLSTDPEYYGLNKTIIAHEVMHTFGAIDHYELGTGIPINPIGLADPNQKPLYPQHRAELMGAYIRLNEDGDIALPKGFGDIIVNDETARDLKWIN